MATPPMLRREGMPPARAPERPDPVAVLTAALLALVAASLLVAGVLAVYDVRTPRAEGPLVAAIAAVFAAAVALNVVAAAGRHLRSGR